jgi:crossover junction endodeoxyribonuclease RuvC
MRFLNKTRLYRLKEKMIKHYIGIDPGKMGSVTILDHEGKLLALCPTPVVEKEYAMRQMNDILVGFKQDAFAIIERAQAMPGQGVVSMFNFGKGYGLWLMALEISNIPYQIVHARTWTRVMLDGAPGEGKERALHVARKLFPTWEPKKKLEYQYADSILLAEYGRRIHGSIL